MLTLIPVPTTRRTAAECAAQAMARAAEAAVMASRAFRELGNTEAAESWLNQAQMARRMAQKFLGEQR